MESFLFRSKVLFSGKVFFKLYTFLHTKKKNGSFKNRKVLYRTKDVFVFYEIMLKTPILVLFKDCMSTVSSDIACD